MVAALAIALSLAAPPAEEQIARALLSSPAGGERAAAATRPLLDAPYLPSALGEGTGRDPDPRFRLDAFDCITLVETAIALGSSVSLDEAPVALDDVRYAGAPSYGTRNHEVLSQWVPENVRKGWIADATEALAAPSRRTEKEFTVASWEAVRAAGRAIPGLPRSKLPLGRFSLAIVPPSEVPALARRLPEGAIAFVVRRDAPDRPTRVTHAGLVIRRPDGAALVRHATRSKGIHRVIEEPLERFVRRQERSLRGWPVEGFAFFTILDNTARVRALAARPPPSPPTEGLPASPPPRL